MILGDCPVSEGLASSSYWALLGVGGISGVISGAVSGTASPESGLSGGAIGVLYNLRMILVGNSG